MTQTTRQETPILVRVPGALAELLPAYIEHRRADMTTLRAAVERGDMACAAMLGHQLKGSGAAFGLPEATRLGAALEGAAKAGDVAVARVVSGLLDAFFQRVAVVCHEP